MITLSQYKAAASVLNCEVAVIQAVAEVETLGAAFLPDGRIKILYEPHLFYRELSKIGLLNKTLKDPEFKKKGYDKILYKQQGTLKYGTYAAQWNKLTLASQIDPVAAYKSTSWGRFQAVGAYHKECGFDHISDMVIAYGRSEYEHLLGFVKMIKFRKLDVALRKKDWATFSAAYNGKNYKAMKYDTKMAAAYKKFAK